MIANAIDKEELNIILVRAGATELDAQGRITGNLDIPLCRAAEDEIRKTAVELRDAEISAIYSAACLSAQQSAAFLSGDRRLKVRVANELTNLDHGLWHGKSIAELKETQPKLFRVWEENPESVCPPAGEPISNVRLRVQAFLKRVQKKHRSGNIVVVAPEPLVSIIKSEIGSARIGRLSKSAVRSGEWETLPLLPIAELHPNA